MHIKKIVNEPVAADEQEQQQQQRQQQHASKQEAVVTNNSQVLPTPGSISHVSRSIVTDLLTDEPIPGLSFAKVLYEPADSVANPQKLGAHGADLEGVRLSRMRLKMFSDISGRAERLENDVAITLLLFGLCLLATIATMCCLCRSKDCGSAWLCSFHYPTCSDSLVPQTCASVNPPDGHRAPWDSITPVKRSPLPFRTGSFIGSFVPALRAAPSSSIRTLCPGLIVPDSCECLLLLPRLVRENGSGTLMITDLHGTPVIKAIYHFPDRALDSASLRQDSPASAHGQNVEEAKPCLMLLALSTDEVAFASCRQGPSGSLVIHHGSNRPYGWIQLQTQEAFEIMSATGLQMHICVCSAQEYNMTDREGRLVAMTDTSRGPNQRAVRIGTCTDAGLVLLALLAADMLKGAAKVLNQK